MIDTAAKANSMNRLRCDQTVAWSVLRTMVAGTGRSFDLRQAFAADPQRFERFSQTAPHVFADLSKNLIDAAVEQQLFALARQCGVEAYRDAMFGGEAINSTEQRAVKHFLLRTPLASGEGAFSQASADPDLQEVHASLNAMLAYAQQVRDDSGITDIVNIGDRKSVV